MQGILFFLLLASLLKDGYLLRGVGEGVAGGFDLVWRFPFLCASLLLMPLPLILLIFVFYPRILLEIIPHMDVPEEVGRLFNASVEHITDDVATMHSIDDQRVDTLSYAIRQLSTDHQSQLCDLLVKVVEVLAELLGWCLFIWRQHRARR